MAPVLNAQEVLTPLSQNPILKNTDNSFLRQTKGLNSEIHLPMREDFSLPTFIPNQNYWASSSVFVNNSYAINPPSIGVVTFDAMDKNGIVYSHMSTFPAVADTFTTNNIRLDSIFEPNKRKLEISDSIYLSFYVQPQGNGASPLNGDSLVLQFYDANDSIWSSVWNINGMSLDTFREKYDTSFLQVLIPVKDNKYFTSKFRFRFYNYARIPSADKPSWKSGLHSQWNLDYIILNINRNIADTTHNDNTITSQPTSLLNEYQSTTWKQFLASTNPMQYGRGIGVSNLDTVLKNVNRSLEIIDLFDKSVSLPSSSTSFSVNLNPQSSEIFTPNYTSYTYNTLATKYPAFRVVLHAASNTGEPDIFKQNDTASFYQRFYNYLAYDDGVPEAGYGLSTINGRLAYKFTLATADTLQSIQMYFNQTIGNANQKYFYLTVWDDNNGQPGNIIYEKSGKRPEFDDMLFKYYTYELENELPVSGTFYIGWRQTTKDNLNVGFDVSNKHTDKIFYNVSGIWYNSSFPGALMIRPILGQDKEAYVGINTIKKENNNSISIFPNPSSGIVNIAFEKEVSNQSDYKINIFSLQGQKVFESNYENRIDLQHLSKGVYIINIVNKHNKINFNKKLIIN